MAFVLRRYAKTGEKVLQGRHFAPVTPGAQQSPQQPGQLPDISTVPERGVLPVPIPEEGPRRPATQYATAEDRLDIWEMTGKDVLDPERYEQFHVSPPSHQEVRNAQPWLRKPVRPVEGYALSVSGSRLSEQLAALEASAESAEASE